MRQILAWPSEVTAIAGNTHWGYLTHTDLIGDPTNGGLLVGDGVG